MSLLAALLFASSAQAADPILPAGQPVDSALFVDLTRYAINHREDVIASFIPTSVPLDSLAQGQLNQSGEVGSSFLGVEYDLSVENLVIHPELMYVNIVPHEGEVCREDPRGTNDLMENGYLLVELGVRVGLNSASDTARAHIRATAALLGFLNFDLVNDTCDIWMNPLPATVTIKLMIGYPRDDNDFVNEKSDDYPDPFVSAVFPSFCPYTAAQWASEAKKAGIPDACRPLFVDLYDFDWHFGNLDEGVQLDQIDIHCGSLISLLMDLGDTTGLLPQDIIADTLQSTADPAIQEQITAVETQLQETIEGMFPAASGWKFTMPEPMSFMGTELNLELCPNEVTIDDRGIRLGMSGEVITTTEQAACIAPYDRNGSKVTVPATGARYPVLGSYAVSGFGDVLDLPQNPEPLNPPEVALGVNDDFLNQALYTLWRGGLLCQTLTSDNLPFTLPAGLSLDTSMLNTLSGSAFENVFPNAPNGKGGALVITTRPEQPPIVATTTSGVDDAVIDVQGFGIDMYGETEGRLARAVGFVVAAAPTIGIDYQVATGTLGASLHLDESSLAPTVVYNELAPDGSAALEGGIQQIVALMIGPLLEGALDGFTFDVPSFAGLGLQDLSVDAAGPGHDWLGAFGKFGWVPYADPNATGCGAVGGAGAGCSGGGGCDGCSGGAGCSSAPAANRIVMVLLPLLVALRRRRHDR